MGKVKNIKTISDAYAEAKLKMDANKQQADAKTQGHLVISKDIGEGWIETVQFIANSIQKQAIADSIPIEAITDESIKDIATIAVKTAIKAADDAKTAGAGLITAIFIAEEAGANAAITSIKAAIKAATTQARIAKHRAAARADVRREIAMNEAASASIKAADVQANEDRAIIRTAAVEAKK